MPPSKSSAIAFRGSLAGHVLRRRSIDVYALIGDVRELALLTVLNSFRLTFGDGVHHDAVCVEAFVALRTQRRPALVQHCGYVRPSSSEAALGTWTYTRA
jgi:hypothetical protein